MTALSWAHRPPTIKRGVGEPTNTDPQTLRNTPLEFICPAILTALILLLQATASDRCCRRSLCPLTCCRAAVVLWECKHGADGQPETKQHGNGATNPAIEQEPTLLPSLTCPRTSRLLYIPNRARSKNWLEQQGTPGPGNPEVANVAIAAVP